MKKIFSLILFSAILCAVLLIAGCGKNKQESTTSSSKLFDTTQTESTSQSTSASSSSHSSESRESSGTSEFFEYSNGTLESTAESENTLPFPMRRKHGKKMRF